MSSESAVNYSRPCRFPTALRNNGGIAYGTSSDHYMFDGKERDSETGNDNFGARYYGSGMGRFLTPDWAERPTTVPYAVFGDPQSLNLHGFVRNDPVSLGDADGHTCKKGDKSQTDDTRCAAPQENDKAEGTKAKAENVPSSNAATAQAQNPFNPTITYDKNLSAKDLAADQSKVGAAVGVIKLKLVQTVRPRQR